MLDEHFDGSGDDGQGDRSDLAWWERDDAYAAAAADLDAQTWPAERGSADRLARAQQELAEYRGGASWEQTRAALGPVEGDAAISAEIGRLSAVVEQCLAPGLMETIKPGGARNDGGATEVPR